MFYDIFERLCKEKGIRPGRAADEIGISRSTVTQWKKGGYAPRQDLLAKIAGYFDVSADYLLGKTETKRSIEAQTDGEITEYLEALKNRSEMRMLFKLSKDATKEEIEQAVKIIEALRK